MKTSEQGVAPPDDKLEKVRRTVNEAAFLVLAALVFVAYLVWPTGITDIQLAQLTLGSLFRVVVSIAITLAALFGAWWWFIADE